MDAAVSVHRCVMPRDLSASQGGLPASQAVGGGKGVWQFKLRLVEALLHQHAPTPSKPFVLVDADVQLLGPIHPFVEDAMALGAEMAVQREFAVPHAGGSNANIGILVLRSTNRTRAFWQAVLGEVEASGRWDQLVVNEKLSMATYLGGDLGGDARYGYVKCSDMSEHCKVWAEGGECGKNRAYMHMQCRRACALCTQSAAEQSAPLWTLLPTAIWAWSQGATVLGAHIALHQANCASGIADKQRQMQLVQHVVLFARLVSALASADVLGAPSCRGEHAVDSCVWPPYE